MFAARMSKAHAPKRSGRDGETPVTSGLWGRATGPSLGHPRDWDTQSPGLRYPWPPLPMFAATMIAARIARSVATKAMILIAEYGRSPWTSPVAAFTAS